MNQLLQQVSAVGEVLQRASGRARRVRIEREAPAFEEALQQAMQRPYWPDRPLWSSLLEAGPLHGGVGTEGPGSTSMPLAALSFAPATLGAPGRSLLGAIRGFDQTSVAEYDSPAQARTWGLATCSAAALCAVLRGSGRQVRIADVMRAMPGGLTPQRGLVSRPALVHAAAQFGADARDDVHGYEALRRATEAGQPVLVSFTNRTFPEGHWVVVTGASDAGVEVADSSRYDLTFIPRDQFTGAWNGRGIRIAGLASGLAQAPTETRTG